MVRKMSMALIAHAGVGKHLDREGARGHRDQLKNSLAALLCVFTAEKRLAHAPHKAMVRRGASVIDLKLAGEGRGIDGRVISRPISITASVCRRCWLGFLS